MTRAGRCLALMAILLMGLSAVGCAATRASETPPGEPAIGAPPAPTTLAGDATATGPEVSEEAPAAGSEAGDVDQTATFASYTSETTSVTIRQVVMGTGRDVVTYFVADIRLTHGTDLQSALSSGTDGGKTEDTSDIARANEAVVAINGDYYAARDDGIIIRSGVCYRDEPARTGLAIYRNGTMQVYEESAVCAADLLGSGVWNTYSFGPALLVAGDIVGGIQTYEADPGARHGIQGTNPRTGIGLIEANHFVFVVVDGRAEGYSRGVTLPEFALIFQELGCTTAYNLDGGGSTTLYFMGEVVNRPSQPRGERAVSDILFVR